jgi:hypothetical protein
MIKVAQSMHSSVRHELTKTHGNQNQPNWMNSESWPWENAFGEIEQVSEVEQSFQVTLVLFEA